MFQKVIYKRQYNKPTIEEIEAEIADEPIPAEVKELFIKGHIQTAQ